MSTVNDDGSEANGAALKKGAKGQKRSKSSSSRTALDVESADVIRLIQSHLLEQGLHKSASLVREESGIGSAGLLSTRRTALKEWAVQGKWGEVLEVLSELDHRTRDAMTGTTVAVAEVQEMAILELADAAEYDVAFATLRLVRSELDRSVKVKSKSTLAEEDKDTDIDLMPSSSRSASIERRINDLMALRSSSLNGKTGEEEAQKSLLLLPPDYYGGGSCQRRRDEIAKRLGEVIPVVPSSRLVTLMQQAVQWQYHTGKLPVLRELWDDDEDQINDEDGDETAKSKTKKKRGKRRRKQFHLVLGQVDAKSNEGEGGDSFSSSSFRTYERIISEPYSDVKFGKRSRPECALFMTYGDKSCLITGASDGLIEVWDPDTAFTELRLDLDYQKRQDLMMHNENAAVVAMALSADHAMLATASDDGDVRVWRLDTGKCLRTIQMKSGRITCLALSPDSSHILASSTDGTCREYGLRTSRLLKEFRGHTSYVNSCSYILSTSEHLSSSTSFTSNSVSLWVVTGSADGTVRLWDGRTAEVRSVIKPHAFVGSARKTLPSSSSLAQPPTEDNDNDDGANQIARSVHTILPLHTPPNTMVIVPRGPSAYLVTCANSPVVLRAFSEGQSDYVSASVSPSNKWLYVTTEAGECLVFDITSGKLVKTIRHFAEDCVSRKEGDNTTTPEITGLVHHPNQGIMACFTNDKSQRRGLVTIWK